MGTKENNITKQDALYEIQNRGLMRGKCKDYIYRVCYWGEEYSGTMFEESDRIMSYICRAYNLTEFGSRSNRIKGALRVNKYTQSPYFDQAFNQIFEDYPNGIQGDYPKFRDLLDENIARLERGKPFPNSNDLEGNAIIGVLIGIGMIILLIWFFKTSIGGILINILKFGISLIIGIIKIIFNILGAILGFLFGAILG